MSQSLHLKYPVHTVKVKGSLKRAGRVVKVHRHCCKCSKNSKNSSSAPQLYMKLNHSICGLYYLEPCCLMVSCMSNILVCRSIWSWNMRRREQYSMFATPAGSKLSLLITDVMSSNSWMFVSCSRHFQLFFLSFNISSISWSIGFLTSSNRSQSRMKCSIFSLSLLHSKQSIFASFLNIFIRLLWSMHEPVSSLSLVGSLWRSPFELQLIFNIGCSVPFYRLTQLKYRRPL